MKRNNPLKLINGWVILGAFCTAAVLMLLSLIGFGRDTHEPTEFGLQSADLTIIPGPTSTPRTLNKPTIDPAFLGTTTPLPGVIAINLYVQITGTEGEGLRFRSEPSLNGKPLFMGFDAEVFKVKDGPSEADGYTWWYLVANYDETRSGWAAANYLVVVPYP
jgi:hypothetical protein